jgi:hypothetical protein
MFFVPVQIPVWISFGSVTTYTRYSFFFSKGNPQASPVIRVMTTMLFYGVPFNCFVISNWTR